MEFVIGTGLVGGLYSVYHFYTTPNKQKKVIKSHEPLMKEVHEYDRIQMNHVDTNTFERTYRSALEEALLRKFKSVDDTSKDT